MEPRLVLKMSQRLILTPTLQQAIKLLQYSRQELVQYVHQELLENPTLEEIQSSEPEVEAEEDQKAEEAAAEGTEKEAEDVVEGMTGDQALDWSEYLPESDNGFEPYQGSEPPSYENILSKGTSLQEHLHQQLNVSSVNDEGKIIGFELIGNIDDNGYLRSTVEEVGEALRVTPERVEPVLKAIQEFDPPGVGARSLPECLALQLVHKGLGGGIEERIVLNHLKDLEARRLKKIAREEKASVDEVSRAAEEIARLEPYPGRSFSHETVHYVVPDITIYKADGEYHVRLVDEGLPQLRINNFYRKLYRSGKLSPSDKEFLDKKVNSARWLIKSILQRQQTILKVARSIVVLQKDFLDHGIRYLKPLVLRTVAEDIDMHESTVSRVTSKKYAQTPQGILELKFFFTSGINRTGGDSMSSLTVMDFIKKIIAEEDLQKPLSDLEIVRRLEKDHSLNIARRTVAKYRGLLNILPASRRRQTLR
jgi:RNA polymerase sigma-54 factor